MTNSEEHTAKQDASAAGSAAAGAEDAAATAESRAEPAARATHADAAATADTAAPTVGVTRRGLFGAVAASGVAGALAGAASVKLVETATASGAAAAAPALTYPFSGEHPAGIVTPQQDRLHFAAFDVNEDATREQVVNLLQRWSYAAERLHLGAGVTAKGAVGGSEFAPPDDTGEALDLGPSGLTITIGFGPTLFTSRDGRDRFGIAAQRPPLLHDLPPFSGDDLVAAVSGGDLAVQACADDPQVAVHAIRNFTRMAFGTASLRFSELGFGRTASTSRAQRTPRNLFGFKDGTRNIKAEEQDATNEFVWVQPGDGPDWLAGGSYMVVRKIRMIIESWDRVQLGEQQGIFGRNKGEGAPLSGGTEFTEPDFAATDPSGAPLIAVDSHVALAHPEHNNGVRILRRAFNYVDGNDALGRLDAGLLFICFQRSPQQFIDIQRNLATDQLNEYIRHVSSGVWAVPTVPAGGFAGQQLFGA